MESLTIPYQELPEAYKCATSVQFPDEHGDVYLERYFLGERSQKNKFWLSPAQMDALCEMWMKMRGENGLQSTLSKT